MDVKAIEKTFEERGIRKVKVGGFDIDGILRGKYITPEKFFSAADGGGFGFCDVIFGWDAADQLYDNGRYTGWHTGYPDTLAKIDLSTFRVIPWEPDTASFLVDFYYPDGRPLGLSPRQLLKNVIARAEKAGFHPVLAAEYEYFLFEETPRTLHEKGFRGLTSLSPGMFGYSWVRSSANSDFVHTTIDQLREYDIELEGFHTETGPGVYESAIKYDAALRSADKAALFKTAMKEICATFELVPTFMAKWNGDLPGCGGHVHQSLWDKDGSGKPKKNLFHDAAAEHRMSKTMRHYVGGQVTLMPELLACVAPTVNSYKRMIENTWAPVSATWGIENRTTALRVIPGSEKSTRIEFRASGADMNPYIAMAAMLAAGLYGVEKGIEPAAMTRGNAYEAKDAKPLPRSLAEATERLERSEVAREILGEEFVDHYVRTRTWEVRQYQRAVTDWELRRYFEVV